jgi:Rad3-related DNA helicase
MFERRQYQEIVADQIVEAFEEVDDVILEAPTGWGKSAVAYLVHEKLGGKSTILMHQKTLQDQYMDFFGDREDTLTIKGKNAYICSVYGLRVDQIICPKKCTFRSGCEYYQLRSKIPSINLLITNNHLVLSLLQVEAFDRTNNLCVYDECLDEDTLIATRNGHKRLKDLNIGDEVRTPSGYAKIKNKWTTKKDAYKYTTSSNKYLISSNNHLVPTFKYDTKNFHLKNSKQVIMNIKDCKNLKIYEEFVEKQKLDFKEYLIGWYIGDGFVENNYLRFAFRKQEKVIVLKQILDNLHINYTETINNRNDTIMYINSGKKILESYGVLFNDSNKTNSISIPEYYFNKCSISLLRGLFDTDGTFSANKLEFDTTSEILAWQVSNMLSSLGIVNTIININRNQIKHNNIFRVCVFGNSLKIFNELIGFGVESKKFKINNYLKIKRKKKQKEDIIEELYIGERNLIDIELDDKNKLFIANGFIVHNCHNLESICTDFYSLKISDSDIDIIKKLNKGLSPLYNNISELLTMILENIHSFDAKDYIKSFEAIACYFEEAYNIASKYCSDDTVNSEIDPVVIYLKCWLSNYLFYKNSKPELFIFDPQYISDNNFTYSLVPLNIDHIFNWVARTLSTKRLYMSATITNEKNLAKTLGIDKYKYIRLDHIFPKENRQIYFLNIAGLNNKNIYPPSPEMTNCFKAIERVCSIHKNQSGVIFTPSYKFSSIVINNMESVLTKLGFRILYNENAKSRDQVLEDFCANDGIGKILISPSFYEGVNFIDDISRFQIICKTPYMSLGSAYVKARANRDQEWYESYCLRQIIQGCGRSVRTPSDYATTYLLDTNSYRLYKKYEKTLSPSFKESISIR